MQDVFKGRTAELNVLDKINYVPVTNPLICIFSLSGFSDYVREHAENCKLIGIDDMYSK